MTDLKKIQAVSLRVKKAYDELNTIKGEKVWTSRERTEGLMKDAGDLMMLMMAYHGYRSSGSDDTKKAIGHVGVLGLARCIIIGV